MSINKIFKNKKNQVDQCDKCGLNKVYTYPQQEPRLKEVEYDVGDTIVFIKDDKFGVGRSFLFEGRILKIVNEETILVYIGCSEVWAINKKQILFNRYESEVETLNSITEKIQIKNGEIKLGDNVLVKVKRLSFVLGNALEEDYKWVGTVRRIVEDRVTKKYKFLVSFFNGELEEIKEEEIEKVF